MHKLCDLSELYRLKRRVQVQAIAPIFGPEGRYAPYQCITLPRGGLLLFCVMSPQQSAIGLAAPFIITLLGSAPPFKPDGQATRMAIVLALLLEPKRHA
jgi:hypothetical protein